MTINDSCHKFLHDAIRTVLIAADRPCTAQHIADEIAKRSLWRRKKDNEFPPASQIRWRVYKRQDWFDKLPDGRIALVD